MQPPQAKEDQGAFRLGLRSPAHAADAQPQPPAAFRDHPRVARPVRRRQAQSAPPAAAPAVPAAVLSDEDRLRRYFRERPGNPFRRHRHAH